MTTPATAATTRFSTTAAVITAPRAYVGVEANRHDADDDAPDRSVQQADHELLVQEPHRARASHLISPQRANHDRHRLIAGVAADARDDWHERRERRQIPDRVLELTDHA